MAPRDHPPPPEDSSERYRPRPNLEGGLRMLSQVLHRRFGFPVRRDGMINLPGVPSERLLRALRSAVERYLERDVMGGQDEETDGAKTQRTGVRFGPQLLFQHVPGLLSELLRVLAEEGKNAAVEEAEAEAETGAETEAGAGAAAETGEGAGGHGSGSARRERAAAARAPSRFRIVPPAAPLPKVLRRGRARSSPRSSPGPRGLMSLLEPLLQAIPKGKETAAARSASAPPADPE